MKPLDANSPPQADATRLLALESRSARFEALFSADPGLGALWRRVVAIDEACASVALEELPVRAVDLLAPALGLTDIDGDPQAMQAARDIHTLLLRPQAAQPGDVLRRLQIRLGVFDDHRPAAADTVDRALDRIRASDAGVVLEALAAAQILALALPARAPLAERALFVMTEDRLRRDIAARDPILGLGPDTPTASSDAVWVLAPALALSQSGLRAWAPWRAGGPDGLIVRLHKTLGRQAGLVIALRSWRDQAEARGTGKRAANFNDVLQLFARQPILTTHGATEALAMPRRTAQHVLSTLEDEGLIEAITPRSRDRVFAVPAMAEALRARPRKRGSFPERAGGPETHEDPQSPGFHDPAFETRVATALSDIDDAMARIDALLDGELPALAKHLTKGKARS